MLVASGPPNKRESMVISGAVSRHACLGMEWEMSEKSMHIDIVSDVV